MISQEEINTDLLGEVQRLKQKVGEIKKENERLDKEANNLTELLNTLYESGIDLQEHTNALREALGLESIEGWQA